MTTVESPAGQSNKTPLHHAAWHGNVAVVTAMLEAHADPAVRTDVRSAHWWAAVLTGRGGQHLETPLHIAAERTKSAVISALLEAKADPLALNEVPTQ